MSAGFSTSDKLKSWNSYGYDTAKSHQYTQTIFDEYSQHRMNIYKSLAVIMKIYSENKKEEEAALRVRELIPAKGKKYFYNDNNKNRRPRSSYRNKKGGKYR